MLLAGLCMVKSKASIPYSLALFPPYHPNPFPWNLESWYLYNAWTTQQPNKRVEKQFIIKYIAEDAGSFKSHARLFFFKH